MNAKEINPNICSDFDDFLREDEILEDVMEKTETKVQTSLRFHESALHVTYSKEVADTICLEVDKEIGKVRWKSQ